MGDSTVVIDTVEADELHEEDIESPDVVEEDNRLITIDTIQNDMDRLIESAVPAAQPVEKKRQEPPSRSAVPKRKPPSPVRPPMKKPEPAPSTVQAALSAKPGFMDALRTTLPTSTEEPVPPATAEESSEEEDEEDSGTSIADEGSDEDDEAEEENEPVRAPKAKKSPPQNGYVADPLSSFAKDDEEEETAEEMDPEQVKLQLLEESAALMSEGFLPAQQPTYAMPIPTLKKIVEQQENQAAEQFGIGLIGFGWVEIIRLIETANRAFDPAAKVFGPEKSLRLDGATEAVAKNIRRYRGPFRYLWKKMQTKKLEEYSPLITMGLVTYDILKEVHKENVRKELIRHAQASMVPTPAAMAAASRYADTASKQKQGYARPSEAPAQPLGYEAKMPGETSTPASAASAAAHDPMMPYTTTATQPSAASFEGTYAEDAPRMIPVDQIRIPESDGEQTAAADDDVVVAVPAPSGGSAKRSRSSTSGGRRRH